MKKLCLLFASIACSATFQCFANSIGPYKNLNVEANGIWRNKTCKFHLEKRIGIFASGYVYTNAIGIVHQFNFLSSMPTGSTAEHAVKELKKTECCFSEIYKLSAFKTHLDSNPSRYLWSEEASFTEYPDWSVRLYLMKDTKTGKLVAQGTIWNAKMGKASDLSR